MAEREPVALPDQDHPLTYEENHMIRRKNYLIKKRFQFNFLSKFIILLVLESALIMGFFMHISNNTLTTGYYNSILTVETTSQYFFVSFLLITLIVVIGIGIAGMVVFILLSHRIAGPLYRFEKTLKDIENGDLTAQIDLRRSDQLIEIKEALNTVLSSLNGRVGKIRQYIEQAEDLVARRDDPESTAKLKKTVDLLKKEVSLFKITSAFKE